MKCKIICDLLPLYIDDVCSDETREAVELHLEKCAACRMEYEKMKAELRMEEAEDLDEKELMEKGKETMTEYVKEKLYRKVILGDTFMNLLIVVSLLMHELNGIKGGDYYYYAEMFFVLVPVGIFLVAELIYWVQYLFGRKSGGSVIVDTICKMSFWLKILLLVGAVAMAAILGFYTISNEWVM